MRTIESCEAQVHFARLLEEVANGMSLTITKHGVPVARLVPLQGKERSNVREVIDALLAFQKGKTLGDVTLRELIDEGRQF